MLDLDEDIDAAREARRARLAPREVAACRANQRCRCARCEGRAAELAAFLARRPDGRGRCWIIYDGPVGRPSDGRMDRVG